MFGAVAEIPHRHVCAILSSWDWDPSTSVNSSFLVRHTLVAAGEGLCVWVPDSFMKDLDCVPGAWLYFGPALLLWVNQCMEYLYLCFSAFQMIQMNSKLYNPFHRRLAHGVPKSSVDTLLHSGLHSDLCSTTGPCTIIDDPSLNLYS